MPERPQHLRFKAAECLIENVGWFNRGMLALSNAAVGVDSGLDTQEVAHVQQAMHEALAVYLDIGRQFTDRESGGNGGAPKALYLGNHRYVLEDAEATA